MSKKPRHPPADDKPDVLPFETVNREIDFLLKRLAAKAICPCWVAQGLLYRGTFLHAEVAGPEATIEQLAEFSDILLNLVNAIRDMTPDHD